MATAKEAGMKEKAIPTIIDAENASKSYINPMYQKFGKPKLAQFLNKIISRNVNMY